MAAIKIKIGVSSCLVGVKVRFDGNHRQDRYLTDVLDPYVDWVRVCPEVEVGMGVPRESVHLSGSPDAPRMLGNQTGKDWTEPMNRFVQKRVRELAAENLCGFILKRASPSCGIEGVPIRSEKKIPIGKGPGLFAQALMREHPLLPVEDEGRLNDAKIRDNFITRIFAYHRLKNLVEQGFHRGELVKFHTAHKYLLLAHSPKHYKQLGQVVANPEKYAKKELEAAYSEIFMEALTARATQKKHVNVLQHMHGFFKADVDSEDRQDVYRAIKDYEKGYVPLIVPMTLIQHFVRKYHVEYLRDQVYLNPHPKELMLRNHV